MLWGIKCNYKRMYQDLQCPLSCGLIHMDCQENLLICPAIKAHIDTSSIVYNDIFSDMHKQLKAVNLFRQILQVRDKILDDQESNI